MTTDTSKIDRYKLETIFEGDYVTHTIHRSDPGMAQRTIEVKERWRRTKTIGSGTFGVVWLQEQEGGGGHLRAVKKIARNFKGVDYSRELATLAKLKDVSVCEAIYMGV